MKYEPVIFALVLTGLGILLAAWAIFARKRRGLRGGETLALDDVTLSSERLKLVGRPDRIVRDGNFLIPEEWKSSRRVTDSHRLQLGVYFLLVEENYGVRPPHGVIVLGDGSRVTVRNTDGLRRRVLEVAEKIREHRREIEREIPVRAVPAKCRACGQRENCRQARTA